jgi:hypothetical protein
MPHTTNREALFRMLDDLSCIYTKQQAVAEARQFFESALSHVVEFQPKNHDAHLKYLEKLQFFNIVHREWAAHLKPAQHVYARQGNVLMGFDYGYPVPG